MDAGGQTREAASIALNDLRRLVAAAESVVYKRLQSHHTWTLSDLFIELLNNQLSLEAAPAIAQAALALAIQDTALWSQWIMASRALGLIRWRPTLRNDWRR